MTDDPMLDPSALDALPPGEVHVFLVALEQSDVAADDAILDHAERERAARLRIDSDRLRFTSARAALRRIAARHLGADPRSIRFTHGAHGKPELVGAAGLLRLNVSHSGTLALVALSRGEEVGVDVERHRRDVDVDGLAAIVCTVRERAMLCALAPEERRAAFFDVWTRKEAVLKALGRGLTLAPDRVEVADGGAVPVEVAPGARVAVAVQPLDVGPGHSAAVARVGPGAAVRLFREPAVRRPRPG